MIYCQLKINKLALFD